MTDLYPVRSATIQAPPAILTFSAIPPGEHMTVSAAEAADAALGDPGNSHHCPLCNQFFGTVAFKQHAPSCITANAPRWEHQRDREPPYAAKKRFGKRVIVAGADVEGDR